MDDLPDIPGAITRMEECRGAAPAGALAAVRAAGGCLRAELYRSYDGPERVVLISHWRDAAALVAYAGPDWRTAATLAPHAHVWHFVRAG